MPACSPLSFWLTETAPIIFRTEMPSVLVVRTALPLPETVQGPLAVSRLKEGSSRYRSVP